MSKIKLQVLGFMFCRELTEVLLLLKDRPAYLKGKLNGIGGNINSDESEPPVIAMVREFKEETGLHTEFEHWRQFGRFSFENKEGVKTDVFCFMTVSDLIYGARTQQTFDLTKPPEDIDIYPVQALMAGLLDTPIVPNLSWMIPMALDREIVKANIMLKG
jgi:8-oxo-dGTP diphosphatase